MFATDHKYSEMAKPLSDELTQATSQVLAKLMPDCLLASRGQTNEVHSDQRFAGPLLL